MSNKRPRKHSFHWLALVVGLLLTSALAQSSVTVAASDDFGEHLVTDSGRSIYLYTKDSDTESACTDACTNNWRPVLSRDSIDVEASGLDGDLLGQITRADESEQVTYGGHPLYTFARDTDEGTTRGQALGGEFFLVSPAGDAITEKIAQQATAVDPDVFASLMADGERVFVNNCAVCHGQDGEGNIGPKLADNRIVSDKDFFVERVLEGFIEHGMPPFRDVLSDEDVAAVTTYVRNSWDNDFGAILTEEVTERR